MAITTTTCTCEICGNAFAVRSATIAYRKKAGKTLPRFCSRKCHRTHQLRGKPGTEICACCGKEFTRSPYALAHAEEHFCSLGCMGSVKKNGKSIPCAACGELVYVVPSRERMNSRFYCSNDCRLGHQFSNDVQKWTGFVESTTEYRKLIDRVRKSRKVLSWRKERLTKNSRCERCGKTEGLVVHHRIPLVKLASDNGFSERLILADPRLVDSSNREVLCAECHANIHLLAKSLGPETDQSKPGELRETP